MLKAEMKNHLEKAQKEGKVVLFEEELNYVRKEELLTEDNIVVGTTAERFSDLYMELANKETDEVVQENIDAIFLKEEVQYFEKNIDVYLYVETKAFEVIGVDSLSLEVDSVFRTYEVLCGLKAPKKKEKEIRSFMEEHLSGDETNYQLMFNGNDGIWDVNFSLEKVNSFHKNMEIGEALKLAYAFLFALQGSLTA
ncbi:branched-chain amino acid aminotransferase [Niallia sp. HCP3S3_B10]|uniref:Branched-chain amino acid aminotransferase n=2 Tax=Niallia TaxID=2837506 RepID=A0ABV1F273_9BACI|nr:branched-chain amino acid aminotransferase [Niallia sp. MER TA 168]